MLTYGHGPGYLKIGVDPSGMAGSRGSGGTSRAQPLSVSVLGADVALGQPLSCLWPVQLHTHASTAPDLVGSDLLCLMIPSIALSLTVITPNRVTDALLKSRDKSVETVWVN